MELVCVRRELESAFILAQDRNVALTVAAPKASKLHRGPESCGG